MFRELPCECVLVSNPQRAFYYRDYRTNVNAEPGSIMKMLVQLTRLDSGLTFALGPLGYASATLISPLFYTVSVASAARRNRNA